MPRLTKKILFNLLEKSYNLFYIDYTDNLSEHLDEVQEAIQGNMDSLNELLYYYDDYDAIEYILNTIQTKLITEDGYSSNSVEQYIEKYKDELIDTIRERDDSDVLKDLVRNTGKQVFFYDTGVYISDYYHQDKKEYEAVIKLIKKTFKIPLKETKYDGNIKALLADAYYGGRLVVYFNNDIDDWFNLSEKYNQIEFENAMIGLIDNGNGSGNNEQFADLRIKLPFDKQNLFLDKATHYSYVYEVCGMYSNFCNCTKVNLSKKKNYKKKIEKSNLHEHLEQEAEYDKVYKSGKCTFGDMNISRHRNTPYINDFPCGNKCTDCGTFWID